MPCLAQASNGAGGQNHQRFAIAPEALADSLTVAAHDLALPVAALFRQLGIEGVPARKRGRGTIKFRRA